MVIAGTHGNIINGELFFLWRNQVSKMVPHFRIKSEGKKKSRLKIYSHFDRCQTISAAQACIDHGEAHKL